MAVSYIGGWNSTGAANPSGSQTFGIGNGVGQAGDIAILVVYSRATTKTVTSVSGPTQLQYTSTANGGMIWVGWKELTSADITAQNCGSFSLNSVSNGTTGWFAAIFRGAAVRTSVAPVSGGASNVPNPPSVNITSGDSVVAIFGKMDDCAGSGSGGMTQPTNYTLATAPCWQSTLGTDGSSGVAYWLAISATSEDPGTFTTTSGGLSTYWYAATVALYPSTTYEAAFTREAKSAVSGSGQKTDWVAECAFTSEAKSAVVVTGTRTAGGVVTSPSIVENGLVGFYRGARADLGVSAGNNSDPTSSWRDLVGSNHLTGSNFAWTTASGWDGNGTDATPYAVQFDGVDSMFSTTTIPIDVDGTFSVSLWAYIPASLSGNVGLFNMTNTSSGNYEAILWIGGTTGVPEWNVVPDTGTGAAAYPGSSHPFYDIRDAGWRHFTVTYNNGVLALFLQGRRVGTATIAGDPTCTANILHIGRGCDNGTYNDPFSGLITSVAIYDRVLTTQEVLVNFNAGLNADLAPTSNALAAEWSAADAYTSTATKTCGHTTTEASADSGNNGYHISSLFRLTEDAMVSKLTGQLYNNQATTAHLKGVIYTAYWDTASGPCTLVAATPEVTLTAYFNGWQDLTFSTPVFLPAGDYYFGYTMSSDTNAVQEYWATGSAAYHQAFISDTYSSPTEMFNTSTTYQAEFAIYATYVPVLHPNSNSDSTNRGTWLDRSGSQGLTPVNFSWSGTDGWHGSGTRTDPYYMQFYASSSEYWQETDAPIIDGDGSWTIEGWVYTPASPVSSANWFAGFNPSVGDPTLLVKNDPGGANQWQVEYWTDAAGDSQAISAYGDVQGGWHHHVWVKNGGTSFYLYTDGAIDRDNIALAANVQGDTVTTTAVALGCNAWSSVREQFFDGRLAVVRLYTGTLTAVEIAQNYQAGPMAVSKPPTATTHELALTSEAKSAVVVSGAPLTRELALTSEAVSAVVVAGSVVEGGVTRELALTSESVSAVSVARSAALGPNFVAGATSTSEAPYSGLGWTGTGQEYASDATNPSATNTTGTTYITSSSFLSGVISFRKRTLMSGNAFAVPAGMTIVGVMVEIECCFDPAKESTPPNFELMQLVQAASRIGNNKGGAGATLPSSEAFVAFGGPADTWGASLTPAIVNSSTFGVDWAVKANADATDVFVDSVRLTVYYTAPTHELALSSEAVSAIEVTGSVAHVTHDLALASEALSKVDVAGSVTEAGVTLEMAFSSEAKSAVAIAGSVVHQILELAFTSELVSAVTIAGSAAHVTHELVLASEAKSAVVVAGSVSHATLEMALSSESVSSVVVTGSLTQALWELTFSSEAVSAVVIVGSVTEGGVTHELALTSESKSAVVVAGSLTHATWEMALLSEAVSAIVVAGSAVHVTHEMALSSEAKSAVVIAGSIVHQILELALTSEALSAVVTAGSVTHALWDLALTSEALSSIVVSGQKAGLQELALTSESKSAAVAAGSATHWIAEAGFTSEAKSAVVVAGTLTHAIWELACISEALSVVNVGGQKQGAVTHELAFASEAKSSVVVVGAKTEATWDLAFTSEAVSVVAVIGNASRTLALTSESVSSVTVSGSVVHQTLELALTSEAKSAVVTAGSITHATWNLALASEAVSNVTVAGSVTHVTWALALTSEAKSAITIAGQKNGLFTYDLALVSESVSNVTITGDRNVFELRMSSEAVSAIWTIAERIPPWQDWDIEIEGCDLAWQTTPGAFTWKIASANPRWYTIHEKDRWEIEFADEDWST